MSVGFETIYMFVHLTKLMFKISGKTKFLIALFAVHSSFVQ